MPQTEARYRYRLQVDDIHKLTIKEYGAEEGYPVVFLHGGPGSGCRNNLCDIFDLDKFRIIAPDQRGAGDSTPKGCLEQNTTRHLVDDLELIRKHLDIEKWLVVGGSWGALLAVAYAECYPNAVTGLVLRSLFLGDDDEIRRAFIDLPKIFRPELYSSFINLLNEAEKLAPLQAYYKRILDGNPSVSLPAICVWHDYERALSVLQSSLPDDCILPERLSPSIAENRDIPNTPRMEAHYFSNRCFLSPLQLLNNADRLHGIAGVIVQARYDLLCPPLNAYTLSYRWAHSRVVNVEGAGHSQSEKGVAEAMREAVNMWGTREF